MTPSNPDNSQPLIYRICDAAGVFHIVAPVNHTHSQAEIEGLAAALAGKANAIPAGYPSGAIVIVDTSGNIGRSDKTIPDLLNVIAAKQDVLTFDTTPTANSTNPVTSGGVKAALDQKADTLHGHTSIQDEEDAKLASVITSEDTVNIEVRNEDGGGECTIKPSNISNLIRALSDPDTAPTANSNKLVTSGGVKTAIDNAIAIRYYPALSRIENIFGDANLQKVDCGILNSTGSESSITDLFLLSHGQTLLLPDNAPTIPNGKMVLLHLYRTATQGQFMVSIGGIYTIS